MPFLPSFFVFKSLRLTRRVLCGHGNAATGHYFDIHGGGYSRDGMVAGSPTEISKSCSYV
jgi:hypothetical protein